MQRRPFTRATTPLAGAFRLSAVSVGLAAAVLASSALPAFADAPPVVTFIDWAATTPTQAQLSSSLLNGTSPAPLTPPELNTESYSVSDDGNTIAVSGWAGGYTANNADVTYGTLVAHRDGGATETRVVSSQFTANPVVSADGLWVWFLNRVYTASSNTPTLALYKYDVANQTTSRLTLSSNFQPAAGTGAYATQLAISADGTNAAIVYRSFDINGYPVNPSRVFAAGIVGGKAGPYFEKVDTGTANTDPIVSSQSLTWGDALTTPSTATTLAFSEVTPATGDLTNSSVDVIAANSTTTGGSLAAWYDITRYNGAWWMWKDQIGVDATDYGSSTDASPLTAPVTPTAWSGSFYVGGFRLSTNTPAAIGTPTNKPAANAGLAMYATTVGYKKTLPYFSWNDYLAPLPGQTFADNYSETQKGLLQTSNDGRTFTTRATTTAANPVTAGGYTWTARTLAAWSTRTLYYRWCFQASLFAAAGCSTSTKVTMIPTVAATITKVGAKRKIVGTATRVGGSVTLYKVVGSKATKVLTKAISAKGAYNFGAILLKAGNYRISTVADGYAGVGSKNFKV